MTKPVKNPFFQGIGNVEGSGLEGDRSLSLASQAWRQEGAEYFSQGGEIVLRDPLTQLEKRAIKDRSLIQWRDDRSRSRHNGFPQQFQHNAGYLPFAEGNQYPHADLDLLP